MGIVEQSLLGPAAVDVEDDIGHALYRATDTHFVQYMGQTHIGYSYNACNAGVAVMHHADYDAIGLVPFQPFSVVYGTSRLFTGLDPDFNALHAHVAPQRPFSSSHLEEHAEQTAIRVVLARFPALRFWSHLIIIIFTSI